MSYICCKNCNEGKDCYFYPTKQKVKTKSNKMQDLILETGKCKLKCYTYPVRIYATDAGAANNHVHGAYQDGCGWQACTWDKYGNKLFGGNLSLSSYNLIPMPVTQYFSIYTNYQGKKGTGFLYNTLEEAKESWRHNPVASAEVYSYSEGVVKKVASS